MQLAAENAQIYIIKTPFQFLLWVTGVSNPQNIMHGTIKNTQIW